jgi:hypothetical protein
MANIENVFKQTFLGSSKAEHTNDAFHTSKNWLRELERAQWQQKLHSRTANSAMSPQESSDGLSTESANHLLGLSHSAAVDAVLSAAAALNPHASTKNGRASDFTQFGQEKNRFMPAQMANGNGYAEQIRTISTAIDFDEKLISNSAATSGLGNDALVHVEWKKHSLHVYFGEAEIKVWIRSPHFNLQQEHEDLSKLLNKLGANKNKSVKLIINGREFGAMASPAPVINQVFSGA